MKFNIKAKNQFGNWLKLSYPTIKEARLHNPDLKSFSFIEELNGDKDDNTKNRKL